MAMGQQKRIATYERTDSNGLVGNDENAYLCELRLSLEMSITVPMRRIRDFWPLPTMVLILAVSPSPRDEEGRSRKTHR
jgi:hypothetical protein